MPPPHSSLAKGVFAKGRFLFDPVFFCFFRHSELCKKNLRLDIFENPVTVTPQQEISKTLNSSKFSKKYLTFTFGERTFTFREQAFTLGNELLPLGIIGVFGFFLEFLFFVSWGVLRLRGSGGPVGVFEHI